jgi:glycosyltransferase involved in cell wall biosynthesis
VFTSHSYELHRVAWKRRALVGLMNRFDRVIALSPFERDVYRAAGVDASKIVVLPLPINVSFFRTSAAPAEPPLILFVANLRPVKNPQVVVRAFQRVQAELPSARLLIAGANLMGAPVETTGWLDAERLREAFARASVVVNSSRHESFGLAIFEAMAAGRPVCLPDLGSLRSLIGDNALYHEPTDDAALAANILRYLREPQLRRAHVEANRKLVEQFDTPKVLARYRALYESVLKG